MDSTNRVGADQLPDESYIERLFPKCPPKQQQYEGGTNWRQKQQNNRPNGRQQQPRQHKRRANRSRFQPNSRAEVEARGSKDNSVGMTTTDGFYNNNNNCKQQLQRNTQANLTDSSDNENVSFNGKRSTQLKRSSSSVEGGLGPTDNTGKLNSGNGKKKTSKYMASQQWQRSSSQIGQTMAIPHQNRPNLRRISAREAASKNTNNQTQTNDPSQPSSKGNSNQQQQQLYSTSNDETKSLQKSKSIDGFNTSTADGLLDSRQTISRTSRGVVFGKPIDRQPIDLSNENSLTSTAGGQQNPLAASTKSSQINPDSSLMDASTAAALQGATSTRTADLSTTQVRSFNDNNDNKSILSNTNQLDTNINFKHNKQDIETSGSGINSTINQLEQKDENGKDKYIDLFVYDNAPSSSSADSSHQLQKRCLPLNYRAETEDQFKSKQLEQPQSSSSRAAKSSNNKEERGHNFVDTIPSTKTNHLANHQLLTDFDESDELAILRNDTSIEELCYPIKNPDDIINTKRTERLNLAQNSETTRLSVKDDSKRSAKDASTIKSNNTTTNNAGNINHHRSSLGSLQPVDEKAEFGVSDETTTNVCCDIDDCKSQTNCEPKLELFDIEGSEMQTSANNNNNLIKKGFAPPGFPQRITNINRTTLDSPSPTTRDCKTGATTLLPKPTLEKSLSDSKSFQRESFDKHEDASPIDIAPQIGPTIVSLSNMDDENHSNDANLNNNDSIDRSHALITNSRQRGEHAFQMPSISEDQSESEMQDVVRPVTDIQSSDRVESDLSTALDKQLSLNSSEKLIHKIDNIDREEAGEAHIWSPQQQSCHVDPMEVTHQPIDSDYNSYAVPNETFPPPSTSKPNHKSNQLVKADRHQEDSFICLNSAQGLNLRHHRLPNETSHYSIVKSSTSNNNKNSKISNLVQTNASNRPTLPALSKSSSTQFNTLSDGDSGPDEQLNLTQSPSPLPSQVGKSTEDQFNSTNKRCLEPVTAHSSLAAMKLDDDLMPSTKTALIFPRLDEGLSSEAESCEDEIEEDDDRAMEADVDADDDEDDDDDVEDDIDNPNILVDRVLQSSVDSYIRQQQNQQQALKTHNRIIGSTQQQQHSDNSTVNLLDQPDMYPAKSNPGYINQDTNDRHDAKILSSYANQNGRGVHWMGLSNQQANVVSSQVSPSNQQYSIQRNNSNGNNANSLPRGSGTNPVGGLDNGSYGRDEAKATNRLSSDTDNETDRLLGPQRADQMQKLLNNDMSSSNSTTDIQPINNYSKQNSNSREVLIEGVLFNVKYLGSTHTDCEGRGEKEDRIHQAEMAVHEVKFRNGESQTATEVQLFVSTEKIMVLDDKHRKIIMDHSLRTISYIADIGDAIVLIVRKKNASVDATNELGRPISKISCHVFESSESHTITKSISQAFQVAYTELLKANGAGDATSYLPKELDYQEVLNSQEMSTAELEMFARKDNQREVIVPKKEGEILGLSIVESGWGSVLPTAVIASLKQDGPAYRCKKLSVGDQILSINGISLVGLSLPECQEILRKTKHQRVARLSVVPCPITVEVKIKRPDTKYQLGFSVQNGVICSLLRGGIAERGGVRVGHRIMSINGTTVVGVPHDKIVTLLASSVGEIRMKTCLTSLYRHMLGEEKAVFL